MDVITKNGWDYRSYRVEGNDMWEFIQCGTHNEAVEVANLVKEKYGREGVIDMNSYGWFIRYKINN